MYCGNCVRDNALVSTLRTLGHDALMVPLYLPLTVDELDQSAGNPVFFSGINVYLEQKSALFRRAPGWIHGLLTSRPLLRWAAGKAAKTRPADLGDLTLSMLQGEAGNQARELDELVAWLKQHAKPDVIFLSNALLLGMGRRLRRDVGAPVVCMLQGEDVFLDGLPEAYRGACWQAVAERAAEADLCIAPSRYFGDLMRKRLGLPADHVRVVYNGINLAGYPQSTLPTAPSTLHAPRSTLHDRTPTLGFFARMCREKGLDTLLEAYILLRQRGRVPGLRLRVGGSCGPADKPLVNALREKLRVARLEGESEFCPNLDHAAKLAFLASLTVFSAPALYGEAFGLYLIEALAAGVPAVQPNSGAFPELIAATGGGVICAAGDVQALANSIEELLLHPDRHVFGQKAREAVFKNFSAEAMAREVVRQVETLRG
jgi:glycosyltransferase involved in cell wall biosynthesis